MVSNAVASATMKILMTVPDWLAKAELSTPNNRAIWAETKPENDCFRGSAGAPVDVARTDDAAAAPGLQMHFRRKRGHPMLAAIAVRTRAGFRALLVTLLPVAVAAFPAQAQDYPTHPITLIVPFPAGGGVDAMGRIVAERLTSALGQQVIVDNRGGAAGVIGTR